MVSTGYSREVERAEASPPAKADFNTLSAGIAMGGGTETTVAASNQTFLQVKTGCLTSDTQERKLSKMPMDA